MRRKIAIVGAGAAGMMCMATLVQSTKDFEIHVFDKNPKFGVKVALTGGGRCNLTTYIDDMPTLLSKYMRGARFIKPAMLAFPPQAVRAWFVAQQLSLKVEAGDRVFPVSDRGQDVVAVFEKLADNPLVKLHLSEAVKSVIKRGDGFTLNSAKGTYDFDIVVITTGGNAYQGTGSNGDGYALAKSLGHSVTQLGPSLNSFICAEEWCGQLAGTSLTNAKISYVNQDERTLFVAGPLLFTHQGISGPAVFSLASAMAFEQITEETPVMVKLIPDSNANFAAIDQEIVTTIASDATKPLEKILMKYMPRRLAEIVIGLAGVINTKPSELTKLQRKELIHYIVDGIELSLIARTSGFEFVTAGGVNEKEINSKTMESRITNNLYFAGEILNVDGLTGGFNLQAAWATGHCVAKNIIDKK